MKSANQAAIRQAFTQQAAAFDSGKMNFSKQEYLAYVVSRIAPGAAENVLEVAAGTCLCGRALAPHAAHVTCLDMTPAMLSVGKMAAERDGLHNMSFVLGDAAELPFLDDSFDVVLSRLAFHHFPEVKRPFAEMARVLHPGGRLVMIDMEAPEEPLRTVRDELETLRDPSHVRNLNHDEMLALYQAQGLNVTCCETVPMPMKLQNWMEHTATPIDVQAEITARMRQELSGGAKTGFSPYEKDGAIWFDPQWTLLIGQK